MNELTGLAELMMRMFQSLLKGSTMLERAADSLEGRQLGRMLLTVVDDVVHGLSVSNSVNVLPQSNSLRLVPILIKN